ncbi:helix-turn-helix domain-containing protein [Thermoanaerobacterium thermosaccharolyticum]|uniref:helix-turn-helix domain-containing protein n=1 Tax=Thermoanaerobacterium thermosaccharolyticum TaxID=1517 RepID=UPI001782E920|nr:helix-turn-helix transcriptional regulator [Thermoanaerobacterium thermosaccharolyticum]MBE0069605.1 helix-turn-helix transcriptional regulator [Thermoanaerobacterium thermosaccharolyticum]MBE0229285.1 helix-turn-helix transcriptional regulator [Thermoanaerobacterium thermosaccharolyticum]WHE07614.1 helix-turn-helix transcriptional regulator [Thermoanaerobacterium thermosaccharolyticum]
MSKEISIGLKIKAAREARGLSQIEVVERLAEKDINMSRETLSKIENGNRTVSAVELNALCKVLNIDINILFEDEEDDDLVTLFRKKNFSEKTVEEVEKLQDMIKMFIYQKKIYNGEFKPQKRKPLWEEC